MREWRLRLVPQWRLHLMGEWRHLVLKWRLHLLWRGWDWEEQAWQEAWAGMVGALCLRVLLSFVCSVLFM